MSANNDCLCKERKCGRCRLMALARARAEAQAAVPQPSFERRLADRTPRS